MTVLNKSSLRNLSLAALAALLSFTATASAAWTPSSTVRSVTMAAASNPGNLLMFEYVPAAGMPTGAPLVVVLPGCGQTSSYAASAGWTKLADEQKFYLVIAQSQTTDKCLRWFDANHNVNGKGDALSIRNMVSTFITNHGAASVDTNKVFVTGLSAGGAMSAVMLATYPNVFHGAGINAGIPYGCTKTATAQQCMTATNLRQTSAAWGKLANDACPGCWAGAKPIVAIFHGSTDATVNSYNMTELKQQWTNYNGLRETATNTTALKGYPRALYGTTTGGAASATPVQTVSVNTSAVPPLTFLTPGMSHGVAIAPGSLSLKDECGSPTNFVITTNICSSYYSCALWGICK
jgi:poly(hydroxyalkanoate) depolymerase family esterase